MMHCQCFWTVTDPKNINSRHKESHAILTKILKDTHEKHARGELPVHEPTEEELEQARIHKNLQDWDNDHWEHEQEAPGMIDALGNQMHDTKYDLQHRLSEFLALDLNKNAFLEESDLVHKVKTPVNLQPDAWKALDTNKDGVVGIREWCAGFHDQSHAKEPWYHHHYGYVYGHDIPDHVKDAKIGAVKKGTAEHAAAKAGVHPAQTQKKLDDKKKATEMKELNEKAHKKEEEEHELHDKQEAKKKK